MTKRENGKGKYNLNLPERVSQIAKSDLTEKTKTSTLTAEQILKNEQAFEDYIQKNHGEISNKLTEGYPFAQFHLCFCQLTQNIEGFKTLAALDTIEKQYIFWYVVNEKEEIIKILKTLNNMFTNDCGIFVVKAVLNDNKIDFYPILAPKIKPQAKKNNNTFTKNLQLGYWQKYFEICDKLESDLQIKPASQHWQYISIGKAGASIQLTINTRQNYVGCELLINNNKEIFYKLEKSKEKIEKQLGELDWQELQGKKSSRIRKIYQTDINNEENWETAIKEQIRMAERFKSVFAKYL
jgi:hypothetical protein